MYTVFVSLVSFFCFVSLSADMEMTQRMYPSGSFSSAYSTSATQTHSNGNSVSTQTLDSVEREFDDDDVEL